METYDNAIEKYGTHPGAGPELNRIRDEHVESIALLERNVREMGGTPSTESGAWGNFASPIQSTANLFGADSALETLKAGEKHGLDEYQDALENDYVMIDCNRTADSAHPPNPGAH